MVRDAHQQWSAERFDPSKPTRKLKFLYHKEERPPGRGPFWKYPEFDIWEQRLISEAVWVEEKDWEATRSPYDFTRLAGHFTPPRLDTTGSWQRTYRASEEGIELDIDRAYDFQVARRLGKTVGDRIFQQPWPDRSATHHRVSVVIDLSVSMEYTPPANQGEMPIVRAILAAEGIASSLEKLAIPVALFGACDGGRRPVSLYRVREHGERFCRAKLRSLHAVQTGGFRYGALMRHLASYHTPKSPHCRHLIVVITDWASHYVAPGLDDAFRSLPLRCRTCKRRPQCSVEPIVPQTSMPSRKDAPIRHVYYPAFYELADAQNAVETMCGPRVIPLFVVLNSGYTQSVLEESFGRDGFFCLQNAEDEPRLFDLIRRKLCAAPVL